MKNIVFRPVSCLVAFSALTVVSSTMSASAETPSLDSSLAIAEYEETSVQVVEATETSVSTTEQLLTESTIAPISQEIVEQDHLPSVKLAGIDEYPVDSVELTVVEPMPGTLATSADVLMVEPETSSVPEATSESLDTTVAQRDLDLRRIPRPIPNWIGIGGNIGLSDNDDDSSDDEEESALGRGAFVINGKLNLVRNISFRPAVFIGDNTTFVLPVTYDFLIPGDDPFAPVKFAPFVGGGAAIATGDNSSVGFLFTGGVEIPLSRQFVANGSINVGFLETTDVGIQLGVGYLFSEF
ncbi:MAG: hypothetical protein F6K14_18155 [Symploca sp. SIO2C1]|nr:hypothetical protein [Symploca sp. SIO2C1]